MFKTKKLSENIIAFWNLHKIFGYFVKKNNLYLFNISRVIDSKKCDYLNARMFLFQNTLRKLTCQGVVNTVQLTTTALIDQLSITIEQN